MVAVGCSYLIHILEVIYGTITECHRDRTILGTFLFNDSPSECIKYSPETAALGLVCFFPGLDV